MFVSKKKKKEEHNEIHKENVSLVHMLLNCKEFIHNT